MGGKGRVKAYVGHMFKPYYKYIMKADFYMSPVDFKGNKQCLHMYKKFKGFPKTFA